MPDDTFTGTGTSIPATDPASNHFQSGKSHARQAADDLKAAAQAKADQLRSAAEIKANELRNRAEQTYSDMRTRAQTLREDSEQYIRQNPTRAVLTALGIGFVIGLMFRR